MSTPASTARPNPVPPLNPATSRIAFLLPAGISLLAGLYAAALLVVEPADPVPAALPGVHGPLMVWGFLGTLIALERSVALRRPAGYSAPVLLGLGGVALVLPVEPVIGRVLLVAGSAATVWVLSLLWQRQRDDPTAVQILAACCALGGALLWLRLEVADLLPWLVGYIVLVIAAERVELARLTLPAWSGRLLLAFSVAVVSGAVATLLWPQAGTRILGAAVLALVGWLIQADVARRTIRSTGLPRYAAAALLLGYLWLAVAAATWLIGGPPLTQPGYDTVVHATFLGFAISMVFAHAPVILPAVLRRPLPYRPVMWLPLTLLHLGLLARIPLGNGLGIDQAWTLGSWVNIAAVLVFVAAALWCSLTARSARRPQRQDS